MRQYKADVLIDIHPCRKDEVRVLGLALAMMRDVSLGRVNCMRPYLYRLLGQEVDRIEEVDKLFYQVNEILWRDRNPWTPYDVSRESFHGLLSHGLECRLSRDEEETKRVKQHLQEVLNYHPNPEEESK